MEDNGSRFEDQPDEQGGELARPASVNGGLPFDAIREINEAGIEEWSARRLQPILGYGAWHRFLKVIEAAMIATRLSGHDVDINFSLSGEVSGTRGPSRLDYRLSRYAC